MAPNPSEGVCVKAMKFRQSIGVSHGAQSSGLIWAAALGIMALGVALRCLGAQRPVWLDEHATLLGLGETLSQTWTRLRHDTHHPLYFLLFNLWSRMGRDTVFLRSFSILTDSASLWVMMAWLRRWRARGALYAGLFFATAPIFLRFGVEMRPYSLLTLTTLLTLWATTQVVWDLRRAAVVPAPGPYVALACAASALVATQPVGVMFLAVCAAWAGLEALRGRQGVPLLFLATALAVPAALFAYLHWVWALPHAREAIAWMPGMSWKLFTGTMRYLLIDASVGVSPWGTWLQQGAWAALWLVFFVWARQGEWRLAALAGAYFLALAAYSVLAEPIFWYRPLLPGLVALVAHMALQVERLGWGARAVWAVLCVVQAAAWCAHAGLPVEPGVGEVLHSSWHKGDRVLYYPGWMRLYVRDEAGFVPDDAMAALDSEPPVALLSQLSHMSHMSRMSPLLHPEQNDTAPHTVHLIMRTELPMARSRSALMAGLQHWEPLLDGVQEIQLLVVPGHDLDVTGDSEVTQWVVNDIGTLFCDPVVEPRDDGLVRVLYRPSP